MIECLGCSRGEFSGTWVLILILKKHECRHGWNLLMLIPKTKDTFHVQYLFWGVFLLVMLTWIFAIFCVYYKYISKIRAHCLKELNFPNWFQDFTGFSAIFLTDFWDIPFWFRMEDIPRVWPPSNSEKWRFIGIPKACCIQLYHFYHFWVNIPCHPKWIHLEARYL